MINVIIADNEVWVCKLIADLVDWKSLGFEIIGTAYDGARLIQMIDTFRPDLIITDIQMPGATGIEVINYIKKQKLNTQVIIISGYSDFEYTSAAINAGVTDYLLKPVESEALTNTLIKYREEKISRDQMKQNFTLLTNQLSQSRKQHFNLYLQTFLNSKKTDISSLESINARFGTSFSPGMFRILLVCLDPHLTRNEKEYSEISETISDFCAKTFLTACYETIRANMSIYLLCLLNYNKENENLIVSLCRDFFNNCSMSVPYISKYDLTLAIGIATDNFSNIPLSYCSALDAAHSRVTLGPNQLIWGENYSDTNYLLSPKTRDSINAFVNCYSEIGLTELLENIFRQSADSDKAPFLPYNLAGAAVSTALNSVSDEVKAAYYTKHPELSLLTILEHCRNIDELKEFVFETVSGLREQQASFGGANRDVITSIKTYVNDHFSENIKLSDIAAYVNFNASYLSELFKNETGENFSKYLMSIRIDRAKNYLRNGKYNYKDVPSMVGYNDNRHFNRIFKDIVGITPKQYQKLF